MRRFLIFSAITFQVYDLEVGYVSRAALGKWDYVISGVFWITMIPRTLICVASLPKSCLSVHYNCPASAFSA
jgi:hypothetical protein